MIAIVVRVLIIYIILAATFRLMGKRQIGQLQISELISALLLSETASAPLSNPELPLLYGVLPVFFVLALEIMVTFIKNKSNFLKKLLEGRPSVLINRGRLDAKELARMRISIEELLAEFRLKGITDIAEVYYAILEQNGQLSVIAKEAKQGALREDVLKHKPKEQGISLPVIVDGCISEDSLELSGRSRKWLFGVLQKKRLKIEEIFLLTVNETGEIYFTKKED